MRTLIAGLLLTFVCAFCMAGAAPERNPALEWFERARLGLFIHWGPSSLTGEEIGWSRGREVPTDRYDRLYREFNPTEFDARRMVGLARRMGARYVVLTTKHHDGFCMFHSDLTDYDIAATPFERDITAELIAACQQAGLRFGAYYSPRDFYYLDHHEEGYAGMLEYMHGQVREILKDDPEESVKPTRSSPGRALDGDFDSAWYFYWRAREGWTDVDLGADKRVGRALVIQRAQLVAAWRLQARMDGKWETLAEGKRLPGRVVEFDPVRARHFRLWLKAGHGGPNIRTFELYPPRPVPVGR
jgi:hypothetical protein